MRKVVLMSVVSMLLVLAVNGKLRPLLHSLTTTPDDIMITEKQVDLDQDGLVEQVSKSKNEGSLIIKISRKNGLTSTLLGKYHIPHSEDGFTLYKGRVANLVFRDMNRDGQLDILISFFDKIENRHRFNALTWNKKEKTISAITEEF